MRIVSLSRRIATIPKTNQVYPLTMHPAMKPEPLNCHNYDEREMLSSISDPLTVIKGYLQFFEKSSPRRDQAWLNEVFREIETIEVMLKNHTRQG